MKKLFLSLALVAASAAAFAVPNPKQIEQALERGNCAQARNLVNEVLAAKPDSARAHLLNSATIMCLERDANLAQRELSAARELDRKGDVVSSNLFAKMEGDIAAAQRPVYTPPAVQYTPPVVAQAAPVYRAPAPAPVVVNNGPSALETGIAVAGGVVVGNAISEALKPKREEYSSSRRRDDDSSSSSVYSSSNPSYSASAPAPYVAPAPAPSVFSSSSDDDWGSSSNSSRYSSSSSPASAPSSWSSSSDDDSSSRSSYSSSSSSDYSSSSSSDYSSSDYSSSSGSDSSSSSDW